MLDWDRRQGPFGGWDEAEEKGPSLFLKSVVPHVEEIWVKVSLIMKKIFFSSLPEWRARLTTLSFGCVWPNTVSSSNLFQTHCCPGKRQSLPNWQPEVQTQAHRQSCSPVLSRERWVEQETQSLPCSPGLCSDSFSAAYSDFGYGKQFRSTDKSRTTKLLQNAYCIN